jgi:hypothetical protein
LRRSCWLSLPQRRHRECEQILAERYSRIDSTEDDSAYELFARDFGQRSEAAEVAGVRTCRGFNSMLTIRSGRSSRTISTSSPP